MFSCILKAAAVLLFVWLVCLFGLWYIIDKVSGPAPRALPPDDIQ